MDNNVIVYTIRNSDGHFYTRKGWVEDLCDAKFWSHSGPPRALITRRVCEWPLELIACTVTKIEVIQDMDRARKVMENRDTIRSRSCIREAEKALQKAKDRLEQLKGKMK